MYKSIYLLTCQIYLFCANYSTAKLKLFIIAAAEIADVFVCYVQTFRLCVSLY